MLRALPLLVLACARRVPPDEAAPVPDDAIGRADQACLDAVVAAGGATGGPLADAAEAACLEANALRHPRCADAWRAWPRLDPSERAALVATACAAAYCDELPAPKPVICQDGLPPPGPAQLQASAELSAAIVRFETGENVRTLFVNEPAAQPEP